MGRNASSLDVVIPSIALLIVSGCAEPLPLEPSFGPMLHQERASGKGEHLLACPSRETLQGSAVIGLEGGWVAAGDHGIRIGPGALRAPTRIVATAPAGPHVLLEITADGAARFEFEAPVQVSISYARCRRPLLLGRTPSAWYVGAAGELLDRMGGSHDADSRNVTFETRHLSTYAVAY